MFSMRVLDFKCLNIFCGRMIRVVLCFGLIYALNMSSINTSNYTGSMKFQHYWPTQHDNYDFADGDQRSVERN